MAELSSIENTNATKSNDTTTITTTTDASPFTFNYTTTTTTKVNFNQAKSILHYNDGLSDTITVRTVCTNDIEYDTDADSFCTISNVPHNNIPSAIPQVMKTKMHNTKYALPPNSTTSALIPSQVKSQEKDSLFDESLLRSPDIQILETMSLQAMEAMAKTAFNNDDDEETDDSGSDSYYSTDSSTDSKEYWDEHNYKSIIHRFNLQSAYHDDNDERESNVKLFKDLLDSDLDQNDSNNPEPRNMEEYIHYTDSDYDSTYSDSDQDYNDGLPTKYTAEEYFSEFYIGDEATEEWKHFEKKTKDLFGDAPT